MTSPKFKRHLESSCFFIGTVCCMALLLWPRPIFGSTCSLQKTNGFRGEVKIIEQRQYKHNSPLSLVATWYYDQMGKETRVVSGGERDGVPTSSMIATNFFNEQGQKSQQLQKWENGELIREITYAYDDRGRQNVEAWHDAEGLFVGLYIREFDEQGNCKKLYDYRPSGDRTLSVQQVEYRYNNLGEKVEAVFERQDGTKEINRYDENGRFQQTLAYRPDGLLESETEFVYDIYGNAIESRTLDSKGTLVSHTKDTYTYDNKKNWIKRISKWVIKEGKPFDEVTITDRTITYYTPPATYSPN